MMLINETTTNRIVLHHVQLDSVVVAVDDAVLRVMRFIRTVSRVRQSFFSSWSPTQSEICLRFARLARWKIRISSSSSFFLFVAQRESVMMSAQRFCNIFYWPFAPFVLLSSPDSSLELIEKHFHEYSYKFHKYFPGTCSSLLPGYDLIMLNGNCRESQQWTAKHKILLKAFTVFTLQSSQMISTLRFA